MDTFDSRGFCRDADIAKKLHFVCGNHKLHGDEVVPMELYQYGTGSAFYRCRDYVSYAAKTRTHASCTNRMDPDKLIKIADELQRVAADPDSAEITDITGYKFTLRSGNIRCRVLSHDTRTGEMTVEVFNPKANT